MPVMQIVEHSGFSWYAVNAAIKRYSETGASAPKPDARGKKQGWKPHSDTPSTRHISAAGWFCRMVSIWR